MLSNVGWINGATSMGVLVCGCIFGLFCIYKSKKKEAKLLLYLGLAAICAGLGQLGPFCDFLTILFTGKNMDNPYGLISLLSFIWLPFSILFAMYLGAELLIREKKKVILAIYLVLGIIYEFFIFLDPFSSFSFVYPKNSGEDLIDDSMNLFSPAGILTLVFALSALIFLGFGFLYQSIKSPGETRKKFLLLSIGMFLYIIFAALDGLTTPGIGLIIIRIPQITGFWFMYFGLRE
jgi:hypothetical protein